MSDLLLVSPIVIPLLTAIVGAFGWGSPRHQRAIGLVGSGALLAGATALFATVSRAGVVVVQVGAWPAPFGITLVADLLAALMVLVSALVAFAVAVYATSEVDERSLGAGFVPFYHVLVMGVCGAFLTGDLFNLYVWFEVMLLASFVLLVAGGGRKALASGIAYVTLNLLASAFFLVAVGVLYGEVGSLNFADLAVKLREADAAEASRPVAMLLLVAFGIKAGLFPVFFWLPAAYPATDSYARLFPTGKGTLVPAP